MPKYLTTTEGGICQKAQKTITLGVVMDLIFKPVEKEDELINCVTVIRESFLTVAEEFNLTVENAPINPAFIELDWLIKMKEKGIALFGVYNEDTQIGFVAIEKAKEGRYYMEKLAVLPEFRHKGYGRRIMDFVCDYIRSNGGREIGIGIINENSILKQWYQNYGFREDELKKFAHLPFTVCLMSKEI